MPGRRTNPVQPFRWSLLTIGTCRVTNTSGVLMVEGKQQIRLEHGRDGQLLVTIDVYDLGPPAPGSTDPTIRHVARLRRNAWAFEQSEYEVTTHPRSLKLTHVPSGQVLLEVEVRRRDEIHVLRARFYSSTGVLIEADDQSLRVGSNTLINVGIDGYPTAAIALTQAGGLAIGVP